MQESHARWTLPSPRWVATRACSVMPMPLAMSTTSLGFSALFLVVLGLALYFVYRRFARRLAMESRFEKGREGEATADVLLARSGYEILEDQAVRKITVLVDDVPLEFTIKPDKLLRRDGERYVADVKTGKSAPSVKNSSTRRQLLEYRVAFPDFAGVLLVAPERGSIQRIRFADLEAFVASRTVPANPTASGRGSKRSVLVAAILVYFAGLATVPVLRALFG